MVFPGKQGIYLENGIRPPFLFYKLGKFLFLERSRITSCLYGLFVFTKSQFC